MLTKKNPAKGIIALKKALQKKSASKQMMPFNKKELSLTEQNLITSIKTQTKLLNKNNITRTMAYYDFYCHHREIEWAFLAHMVSRNAGWTMTDLKGEFLSTLLSEKEQHAFFSFLERGNWLIFQDAYPQLLLYEESVKQQTPLFHLIPFLNVSVFMETVWPWFWKEKNRTLLTIALIMNEQNYIEKRIIQHQHFQTNVLHTIKFILQDELHLNHLLFPYCQRKGEKLGLIGKTMHQFPSLHERILFGKHLYALLFHHHHLKDVLSFAANTPHTGSRKDYWPHLFHEIRETPPGILSKPRIKNCTIKEGYTRLYSPRLQFSWENVDHEETEKEDWFTGEDITSYLSPPSDAISGEITKAYCQTLIKLELAMYTKQAIFQRKD